jgi:nicotinamidase-related amidase
MGGEVDLNRSVTTPKSHDFIAAVRRKDDRFELFIPPSYTRVFDSNAALDSYLKALGIEETGITPDICHRQADAR